MTKPAHHIVPQSLNLFEEIRAAYARRDPIAKTMRRDLARELFHRGEQSVAFVRLLLVEAEHAQLRGEWSRAEALGRRAAMIADGLGSDPRDAKGALARAYRARTRLDPALLEVGVLGGAVVQVDLVSMFMRLHLSTLDYVGSPPHLIKLWLLIRDREQCRPTIEGILADMNRRLAQATPWDSSYTAARPYQIRTLEPGALANMKRGDLALAPLFLPSALFVADAGRYAPASIERFIELAPR